MEHQQSNVEIDRSMQSSGLVITAQMPICQTDLPLDWYQDEFKPYAEEFLALPDRKAATVLRWMDGYIQPALDHFGPDLMLLAHYYMGGEIVKLVERYGGHVADSYELALQAVRRPETTYFVESAVHFMAETIAILAHDHQEVYITNPKSGCTMEALAKEAMVEPVFEQLLERYGDELLVICYMNTSGRIKAMAGQTGGAVCTSSNAPLIMKWARERGKRILFVPDQHLAENSARAAGIPSDAHFVFPPGWEGARVRLEKMSDSDRRRMDDAELLIWGSFCGVHTIFEPRHVAYWRQRGYRVLVHPESRAEVVIAADGSGSTNFLWKAVQTAEPGAKLAIGTEGHFVRNAALLGRQRGVEVVHLADIPDDPGAVGCGCATMSRNDPPHLVATLDLLRRGQAPALNRVMGGDMVDESTGWRTRLPPSRRAEVAAFAKRALHKMIELTEAAKAP